MTNLPVLVFNRGLCDFLGVTSYQGQTLFRLLILFLEEEFHFQFDHSVQFNANLTESINDIKEAIPSAQYWDENEDGPLPFFEIKRAGYTQYNGFEIAINGKLCIFFGKGAQGLNSHFYLRVAGSVSHAFLITLVNFRTDPSFDDLNISRIDLQLTVELPQAEPPIDYRDLLNRSQDAQVDKETQLPGRNRSISTEVGIGNGGSHKITVGKRHAERLMRTYVKANGEGQALRFEVEYKHRLAKEFLLNLQPNNIEDIICRKLDESLATLESTTNLYEPFRTQVQTRKDTGEWQHVRSVVEPIRTLEWFKSACTNTFPRLVSNPDTRAEAVQIWKAQGAVLAQALGSRLNIQSLLTELEGGPPTEIPPSSEPALAPEVEPPVVRRRGRPAGSVDSVKRHRRSSRASQASAEGEVDAE